MNGWSGIVDHTVDTGARWGDAIADCLNVVGMGRQKKSEEERKRVSDRQWEDSRGLGLCNDCSWSAKGRFLIGIVRASLKEVLMAKLLQVAKRPTFRCARTRTIGSVEIEG